MKQNYIVSGMSCSACAAQIEKKVNALAGVRLAQVNLLAGTMAAEYDDAQINDDAIIRGVTAAGYSARVRGAQASAQSAPVAADEEHILKQRLIVSIVFLVLLMYVSMGSMIGLPLPALLLGHENALSFALTQFLLTLPICFVNRKFYTNGFRSLIHGAPTMDSLIAIGSGAALLYGIFALYQIGFGLGHGDMTRVMTYSHDLYFESAGMILTLITVGKTLEARAKGKTGAALASLMNLAPKTAAVEREGVEITVPIGEVAVDDIVCVRPGQSVPVDGIIVDGQTAIDESALTGESIPAEKVAGDSVYAATINKTGFVRFRASKVGDDTTLAQIIRLVEEASASKAPIAKLADKVSGIFVPAVLVIALLATIAWLVAGQSFTFALSIGIAILVISCPCALGLATPVAIMVGTGVGASMGVLFKSAQALETLHTVTCVVLDKTGTVTQGHPRVTDLLPAEGETEHTLLTLAFTLEQPSEHPLAEAIVLSARQAGIIGDSVAGFDASPGRGVRGTIDGALCRAGNARLMREEGIELGTLESAADAFAKQGKTPLFFARNERAVGVIAIADIVKESSAQAVHALQEMGLSVVMLTGDNAQTAQGIGAQVGIPNVIAEVLPQDKEGHVRQLQERGNRVAMIGDGINDAPALARADVGIAIGAGADIAIESADVVLMKSDLMDAVNAIRLSASVIRNIKQNLFWAFFYNCIGIPLAAGVFFIPFALKLSPMFGAAAMSLSSVCVVSNALRLRWFRPLESVQKHSPQVTLAQKDIPNTQENRKEMIEMKKTITIEGMMCTNCSGHVTKALENLAGVTAKVSHETGLAEVTLANAQTDDALRDAVTQAGYQVRSIQ